MRKNQQEDASTPLSVSQPSSTTSLHAQQNDSLNSLPSQATSSQRRLSPEPTQATSTPQQGQPEYAYPSWLSSSQQQQCEAPPPASTSANAMNPTADELGYAPMEETPRPHNNIHTTSINSATNSTSSSSVAAQWFALETTAEDRLSCHIIAQELKDLVYEIFHFLKHRHWKKKLLTVLVVVASVCVFLDLMFGHYIQTWIDAFLVWMTDYPTAAEFVFMGIYVLATILFIPPTLLLFGGGWAFSQAWDSIFVGICAALFSCFLGSVIGALLSFVRARYMMRDLIELFCQRYPIVRAADKALKRDGLRIMFLLRMCPLIPFHGLNYLGGITGVSWDTFLVSLTGILPYQILVITMGATAGNLHSAAAAASKLGYDDANISDDYYGSEQQAEDQRQMELQNLAMLIVTSVGFATLVIAMILAFRFTKKELQKELQVGEGDMESYIRTVRRMSMIDLYDSYRFDNMVETKEGMEVIKASSHEVPPMMMSRFDKIERGPAFSTACIPPNHSSTRASSSGKESQSSSSFSLRVVGLVEGDGAAPATNFQAMDPDK